MKLLNYEKVTTLEEAYTLVQDEKNQIIGGGGWLKLTDVSKNIGIDLELLELNKIWEDEDGIHLGSMCTLRDIELSPIFHTYASGILSQSASVIMGVTLRNIVTIGGTVCGKYGFSDLITVLLALGADLNFYHAKRMTLEAFLQTKGKVLDILTEIIIPKENAKNTIKGYFEAYKKTSLDFSLVNVAIVRDEHIYITIGSRPGVAKRVSIMSDSDVMKKIKENNEQGQSASMSAIVENIVSEFSFGSNPRASKEYRIELAKTYVLHGLREVLA